MKKLVTIILVIAAIPLYSYNVYLLIKGFIGSATENTQVQQYTDHPISFSTLKVQFIPGGKSPFLAYAAVPLPKPIQKEIKTKPIAPVPKKELIEKPEIKITGIMWNPDNPIAMINLPDGTSVVARNGQVFGDIAITKIEQNKINIVFKGKQFSVER